MRNWRIIRRTEPSRWGSVLLFCLAFILALCISGFLLETQGKDGVRGVILLLEGGFGHDYSLEDTLLKTIPIFLCAAGVTVCFRMQIWNIGAEGQYVLGSLGATAMVLAFPQAPAYVMLPGLLLFAALAGALWAIIPAGLRLLFRMNEIISSLMLNYVAIFLLEYLVYGPWKDPKGSGFPMSIPFPRPALIPGLFGRVHWGLVFCLLAGLLLGFFFKRTRLGYEILATGENVKAAKYAGMPFNFLVIFVFCLCGALAGLAGGLEVSATLGRLRPNVAVGYGYTAIIVAWLARLRVTRIAFFSFLLAGLRVGVENLQLEMAVPAAFAGIIEGSILIIVLAGQFFEDYAVKRKGLRRTDFPPPSAVSLPEEAGAEEGKP